MEMKKYKINKYLLAVLILTIGVMVGRFILPSNKYSIESSDNQTIESSDNQIFTCSMHPQIRQNEPGKCPICGMDLIPLTQKSDHGESSPFIYSMSPEAIALANVQTQIVKSVSPEHEINLTGKIAVNEQRLAVITANYSGRIDKLFVDFTGQLVTKGDRLATIYSPELVTAQTELIEAAKFKDINPALYNAVKEKLRLWKISDEQINQIENNEFIISEFIVYANESGIVIRREISKGDYVNKGDVLLEIADLSSVWILFDAYENDLPLLKIGQKLTFSVSAVPGQEYNSSITFINPMINPQTRTSMVRAVVSNPGQRLKPEMFVHGKIKASLSVNKKSIVIPKTSLLWTGRRSVVYIKVPDAEFPAFEMREISLGTALGEYYIVESGLTEGEEIVSNGVFAIDAAAQLSGNYSMMNRPVDNRVPVPNEFASQLTGFLIEYFELKNSLVKSDFQQAKANIPKLESALRKIESHRLDEKARLVWDELNPKLKKQLESFARASDIEQQREQFGLLSDQLIETVEKFNVKTESVYVAFCPMALNDQGAYWLSEFEDIKNPYFGDKMLRCGEVKKTINSKREQETNTSQSHQH